ncbi:MAG: hypothetical protein K9N62_13360 [Verrucomicrobia bacterium]|nr:hypothetical protein [Verrucomicrobiota bacterium]
MGFSVSFSPDAKHLAVGWAKGSGDPRVDLWDVEGRHLVRSWQNPGNVNYQGRAAFSPVRNLLVATTAYKTLSLVDLDAGRESILWRAPAEGWWTIRDLSFPRGAYTPSWRANLRYGDCQPAPKTRRRFFQN